MLYDNLVGGIGDVGRTGRVGIIEYRDGMAGREVVGDGGATGVARKVVKNTYQERNREDIAYDMRWPPWWESGRPHGMKNDAARTAVQTFIERCVNSIRSSRALSACQAGNSQADRRADQCRELVGSKFKVLLGKGVQRPCRSGM